MTDRIRPSGPSRRPRRQGPTAPAPRRRGPTSPRRSSAARGVARGAEMDRPVAVEPDPDPVLLVDAVRLPTGRRKSRRNASSARRRRNAPLRSDGVSGRRSLAVSPTSSAATRSASGRPASWPPPGSRGSAAPRRGSAGREDLAAGPVADRAVRSGEEAAIGLEAADDPRPVPRRPLHAGDHEGRADPGAQHAPEAARALDGRAGRHRHHDGVGAEIPGGDQAEDVAPQDAAACIGDEGTVGVAVGGDERVERAGGHGLADERDVLRAMASVSIGTNVSDRPIGTASAPRADSTSTSTSRATELCW